MGTNKRLDAFAEWSRELGVLLLVFLVLAPILEGAGWANWVTVASVLAVAIGFSVFGMMVLPSDRS